MRAARAVGLLTFHGVAALFLALLLAMQAHCWISRPFRPLSGGVLSRVASRGQCRSIWALSAKRRFGGLRRKIEGDDGGTAPRPSGEGEEDEAGEGVKPAAEEKQAEEWSMEWIQSLSPEEVLALDKNRLMDVLIRDIEGDREWAKVRQAEGRWCWGGCSR